MKPIPEIKRRLDKLTDVRYECDDSSITVFPTDETGFTVTLTENSPDHFTVFFEGWHEDFTDAEEAMNAFAFGLSDECRLKESRRGSFAYKWTVESLEDGKWQADTTTGLLLFPFWRKPEIRYLQNKVLSHGFTQMITDQNQN